MIDSRRWRLISLLLLFGVLLPVRPLAQQTVFNVPSADVLDRGKIYTELDVSFKTNCEKSLCRFSSFAPRIVGGVGHNIEVGLNLAGNIQPGPDSTTLVPTVKWRFYRNEKKGVDLYTGNNLYIPVRNRAYDLGTYTYLSGAKTIKNTRLTAGGYITSKNVYAPNAARGGGQFAIEQTLSRKLKLAADWITGQHAAGYLTPGLVYNPHPRVTTYWSYSIGNAGARTGNHFFLLELGYAFD